MKLLQPELFPNLSWFIYACKNNQFLIDENPRFLQNKFLNKFAIPGPNQIQSLIIPVLAETKNGDFDSVKIDYSQKWIREHKNALQTAYGKSPFFEYYDYRIFNIYDQQIEHLSHLNHLLFNNMRQWIGLQNIQIVFANNQDIALFDSRNNEIEIPEYNQVFHEKFGFRPQVSILDLLFNQGPLAKEYFQNTF